MCVWNTSLVWHSQNVSTLHEWASKLAEIWLHEVAHYCLHASMPSWPARALRRGQPQARSGCWISWGDSSRVRLAAIVAPRWWLFAFPSFVEWRMMPARSPFHRRQTVYFQVSFLMNTQFILGVGEEGRGGGRATAAGGLGWNEGGQTVGDNGIKKGGKQMFRVRKWRKPLLSSAAHGGPAGGPWPIKGFPVMASPAQNILIAAVDTKNTLRIARSVPLSSCCRSGRNTAALTQLPVSGQRVTLRYTHKTSLWDLECGWMPSFYSKIAWGPTGAVVKPVLVPRKHPVLFRICTGLTRDCSWMSKWCVSCDGTVTSPGCISASLLMTPGIDDPLTQTRNKWRLK